MFMCGGIPFIYECFYNIYVIRRFILIVILNFTDNYLL